MKINILLFTQTMHSLLSSHLSLQNALEVCSQILTAKKENLFVRSIKKRVKEGEKLSRALGNYKKEFSALYISLVSIGEESGTLADVFGHLSIYLKSKNNMTKKIVQALLYPVMVFITAVALVVILILFVVPRLKGIFEAFSSSSYKIAEQMKMMEMNFILSIFIILTIIILILVCLLLRKVNNRAAYLVDSFVLKIPGLNKFLITMQMNDFSFALKLFSSTHFPLIQSLKQAETVLNNTLIKNAVDSITKKIMNGVSVGEAFESEKVFPKYFTVWVKIAEENGDAAQAFGEISDYYSFENENLLTSITQIVEPVFILITGILIISLIIQFVIPIFNLLGEL